jgi:hypothetical protein
MYGDYDNSDPTALGRFATRLQGLAPGTKSRLEIRTRSGDDEEDHAASTLSPSDSSGNSGGIASTSTHSETVGGIGSTSSGLTQGSNPGPTSSAIGSSPGLTIQTNPGGYSSAMSPIVTAKRTFFELCVNTGFPNIKLSEIEITDVTSDAELFRRIYQEYRKIRAHRMRRIFIKPTNIHFVLVSKSALLILPLIFP